MFFNIAKQVNISNVIVPVNFLALIVFSIFTFHIRGGNPIFVLIDVILFSHWPFSVPSKKVTQVRPFLIVHITK